MKSKSLLFASYNQHKLEEFRQMLPPEYQLSSLHDIGFTAEIAEPFESFGENALAKTSFVFQKTGRACFADDSGLEIDALEGRPGVRSARYAGEGRSSADNINQVLKELGNNTERNARFVAVIAYQLSETEAYLFQGTVEGRISDQPIGEGGFGYDPIFIPSGFDLTFGQLSASIKNQISHRAKALDLFLNFLKEN
ncbi:MAG TPA: RdgB/HAM1 family non-canonical purine NTP pyrophosphatase [Saprospiraceae bacterium]|jgi:XTP/dITP diphosphohydrolase